MTAIEVFSRQRDNTGEGPLWSATEQVLYWLDIGRKVLYRRSPSGTQPRSWALADHPGCLAELAPGMLAIAMGQGLHELNLETGAINLMRPAPSRRSGTRFNDGKVDPKGRLWAGTMQNNFATNGESIAIEHRFGMLYRFETDGSVSIVEQDIACPNTLAWSPDQKRFYFGDSLQNQIWIYDYDAESGVTSNKRTFFEGPQLGLPDGSAIDVDGCLWNARWDGGVILRITPTGKLDRVFTLPVQRPTSCSFGGPDMSTLFITSACNGLTSTQLEQNPLSGSVLAIHGVGQGLPVPAMVHHSPLSNARAHRVL
jgi:L-arabinonolactonase